MAGISLILPRQETEPANLQEMSMSSRVRWGVLSTAGIGAKKVVPAILKSTISQVVAVASRDISKADGYISRLGLGGTARAYGSYEELLADPNIDAIYNPLPNHLHVQMTLQAARAGKHVLCEKPVALSLQEAEQLREIPENIVFAEAFMFRYHPQWQRARAIVRSGELGDMRSVRVAFCYFNDDPANVRNRVDAGGGTVYDVGCYAVAAARYLFGSEPRRVVSLVDRDPGFKTDRLISVLADFGSGRQLAFTCSTQTVRHQSVEIIGTRGRVEIVIPFNAPTDDHTALLVDHGASLDGTLTRREIMPVADQYTEQADAFCRAVLGMDTLEWGVVDAIANTRVLEAIFASERNGAWQEV
ncbi:Gfo/Idh/MocA family oxidoreductase [Rhizobium hidalgonense]|uniref:Gfo/Idh/MocA family oxidoreductase n=2 Tax=Rhizobium/Agrobacterium group TaxID=227290 RepID=A0AAJ2GRQ1_9HYPH|nr:Gfo/Idh/MocA family oxidoreductase [Rhizobium hidalgonense]MDR9774650.1 Gfo/Idh/MocA family oxidoreductase [Rhizobium hidalgonense]MDR9814818.1 Gfo/Idh/MocA family oxidoreductase [Rhizobium hidalgonense]MDR9818374.1 Gfo/Idh/MocA family oxidoreductase [Rhizobium hidalgonense]